MLVDVYHWARTVILLIKRRVSYFTVCPSPITLPAWRVSAFEFENPALLGNFFGVPHYSHRSRSPYYLQSADLTFCYILSSLISTKPYEVSTGYCFHFTSVEAEAPRAK